MEKLYEQFVVSATKWKAKFIADEFLIARIKLTFLYSLTATVILAGASFLVYKVLIANLYDLIRESIFNPIIAHQILDGAQDSLRNRLITVDSVIIIFVVILGFFLTQKTLKPIKTNAEKQKKFIADASHELRTPVAIAISGLEVALRNKKLDVSSAKVVLEKSLEEMRELSKLSNNLLDIVKFNNHQEVIYEDIIISNLIKSITSKMQPLALNKKINLETKLENSVTISGNSIELGRVFYNILDNAITHTQEGGTIIVSDSVNENDYTVQVKDTGSGISKDVLEKVFDPFFQGDTSRNASGAGLGLTLAKKIIENHKGTISIKSEVNKGTTVIISLPI